ncbi:MAG: hypothetical protein PVH87_27905 [Desulfobacteraceae bacterium]|jgi:hypothetical protein
MSLADGFLFGYLRRQAIEERKKEMKEIEWLSVQVYALKEVIGVLVPEGDVRREHVDPLYQKLLRKECIKRNLPSPV